jgi:thioredoxin-like negative regulator of GroEL
MLLGDLDGAEDALRQYLGNNPDSPAGLLALVRLLLLEGRAREAKRILTNFPASYEFNTAQLLKPVADAYLWLEKQQDPPKDALDAAYRNSLRLAKQGKIQ